MDHQDFALTVIAVSVLAGLYLGAGIGIHGLEQLYFSGEHKPVENSSGNSSFVYGSSHEHALFYVVVNETERDFTAQKFQLNSRYVHLESNRSHIVHKHAKGVTWKYFFDTINLSVSNSSQGKCVSIYNESFCGDGKIVLNGESDPDLDTEVQQGDNFAIVLGENATSQVDEYMKKQLPRLYKPSESRGRRL